jgi:hypothetical protein
MINVIIGNNGGQLSLAQNLVGFVPGSRENRTKPGFPAQFREAVPKNEALEQPRL